MGVRRARQASSPPASCPWAGQHRQQGQVSASSYPAGRSGFAGSSNAQTASAWPFMPRRTEASTPSASLKVVG